MYPIPFFKRVDKKYNVLISLLFIPPKLFYTLLNFFYTSMEEIEIEIIFCKSGTILSLFANCSMILGIIISFVMLEFIGEDAICTRIRSIFCFNNTLDS